MALFNDIQPILQRYIRRELQSTYTVIPVVVKQVDRQNRRCEIARKDREEVLDKNAPIASPYTGDGYGEIYPIRPGDEAFLLCCSLPLEDLISRKGHVDNIPVHRNHSFHDGVVFPRMWFDPDTVPDHGPSEYLLFHESGTFMSIDKPEHGDGAAVVEHPSGYRMRIQQGLATLETGDGSKQLRVDDAGATATVERPDGKSTRLRATETGVEFRTPDDATTEETDKWVRIAANDDGTVVLEGDATIGDPDAKRVDPSNLDSDGEPSETTEDKQPFVTPASATTTYDNPLAATLTSRVNFQFYDSLGFLFPRRADHPDPTVSDPSNDAYIELPDSIDSVPNGYLYWLTSDWTLYGWRDGTYTSTNITL